VRLIIVVLLALVVAPNAMLAGVPKGIYKLTEDVAKSDDPAYTKALLVSGGKREHAAKLRVDVHSSNTVLQEELNSIGWAEARS
jgi:hypothetical protein